MNTETIQTDVMVLGGGIAGCFAAIAARDMGLSVLLMDKGHLGRSGTSFEMSGVLSYFDPSQDDAEAWYRECVEAGQGVADQDCLAGMVEESTERIEDLRRWGVEFVEEKGRLVRRPGVGHHHARNVVMTKGGFQLQAVLRGQVKQRGILVLERIMAVELLPSSRNPGQVTGAVGFNIRNGRIYVVEAKATVIATGSTRSIWTGMKLPSLSGDGKAMALRAGCVMRNIDLSYFQEAPARFNTGPGANLLYGLGARLVNARGERFMERWDPVRLDRAPRAVHCRAIATEELEGRGPVFMDATGLDDSAYATMEKALPILLRSFRAGGLDLSRDKIPYTTVLCDHGPGGIRTNAVGATNVGGLFAAGDAMDHGSDGASNILTHGILSGIEGYRAGRAAGDHARAVATIEKHDPQFVARTVEAAFLPLKRDSGLDHGEVRRHAMVQWPRLGPVRDAEGMGIALKEVRRIRAEQIPQLKAGDYHELSRCIGLTHELLLLELLAMCALYRTESRGSHFRRDYPDRDDRNWLKWVLSQRKGSEIRIWDEPVPVERYSIPYPLRSE